MSESGSARTSSPPVPQRKGSAQTAVEDEDDNMSLTATTVTEGLQRKGSQETSDSRLHDAGPASASSRHAELTKRLSVVTTGRSEAGDVGDAGAGLAAQAGEGGQGGAVPSLGRLAQTVVPHLRDEEGRTRTQIKQEEDNGFLSVCHSLSSARRSDVDLQLTRDENMRVNGLLDSLRERLEQAERRTREAEHERDSATEDARVARRRQGDAERETEKLERTKATLENRLRLEKSDLDTLRRRAEADTQAFREEREMLLQERSGLLRQRDSVAELQQHSVETEELNRAFRDQCASAQRNLDVTERERDHLHTQLTAMKEAAAAQAEEEARRTAEHNRVTHALRQEVQSLEVQLREATAESESKLHADMQAMLSMQGTALERDAILVALKEEAADLRDQLAAVTTEKQVLLQKLVKEREAHPAGDARLLRARDSGASFGASSSQHLLRSVVVQTEPHAAPGTPPSMASTSRLPSGSGSASLGERASTCIDLFPFHCVKCGACVSLTTDQAPFRPTCDAAEAARLSLEGLKDRVERCAADTASMRAVLAKKEEAHGVLQNVLEKRLLSEIESLHACRAGRGAAPPHVLPPPVVAQEQGGMQTPSPSPAPQTRNTEDDLQSLRRKVTELKYFQRQMLAAGDQQGRQEVVQHQQHQQYPASLSPQPFFTPMTLRSTSSSATAIAMEAVPRGHDPRFLSATSLTHHHSASSSLSQPIYRSK